MCGFALRCCITPSRIKRCTRRFAYSSYEILLIGLVFILVHCMYRFIAAKLITEIDVTLDLVIKHLSLIWLCVHYSDTCFSMEWRLCFVIRTASRFRSLYWLGCRLVHSVWFPAHQDFSVPHNVRTDLCILPSLLFNGTSVLFPEVKRPRSEGKPLASIAKVKNALKYTATSPYLCIAWCVIKHWEQL
jgi:hypothetical protein